MKKVLSFLGLVLLTNIVLAQQTLSETTINIKGEDKPAISKDFNETASDIADALTDYFKTSENKKLRKRSGLYIVQEVKLDKVTGDDLDLYFNIEVKGRKKDKTTTVALAAHTSLPQFVGESTHVKIKQNIVAFIERIQDITTTYQKKVEAERLQKEAEKAKKEKERLEKKAAKQAAKAAKMEKAANEAKANL